MTRAKDQDSFRYDMLSNYNANGRVSSHGTSPLAVEITQPLEGAWLLSGHFCAIWPFFTQGILHLKEGVDILAYSDLCAYAWSHQLGEGMSCDVRQDIPREANDVSGPVLDVS